MRNSLPNFNENSPKSNFGLGKSGVLAGSGFETGVAERVLRGVSLGEIKVAVSGLFRLLFRVLFRVQVSESCFNFDSVFDSVFNSVFGSRRPGIFADFETHP